MKTNEKYSEEQAQKLADKIVQFAAVNKLRPDWHEPDNQDVYASVTSGGFDNAFGDTPALRENDNEYLEQIVRLTDEDGNVLLNANLANLFACVCYLAGKE